VNNICYIVSAGDCTGINILKEENDIVIAADGGLKYLEKAGVTPDVILGDFDSLGFKPEGANVISYCPEKDDTDTMLAVKLGIEKGFKEFIIYGALGGRLDHTIANLTIINYLSDQGCKCTVIDEHVIIRNVFSQNELCENMTGGKMIAGKLTLDKKDAGTFSIFSLKDVAKGVSIVGAKYEVENITFTNNIPLGVSNEFVGKEVVVEVADGQLIVMENIYL